MAILEGMASSLPIIATPVGDVPVMVHDGLTGVMVPPENAALLASAIVALLRNPAQRERLGAAARKLIEDEFTLGDFRDQSQTREEFLSLIKKKHDGLG